MQKFKTIIIGSGAAGCMCAMKSSGNDIAIIDKATQVAKKILVTGNGRCNLTNTAILQNNFNANNCTYNTNIDEFFEKVDSKKTLDFFESIGLETHSDEEGRVYPISNMAKSVQDVMAREVEKKAQVFLSQKILRIQKMKDYFEITTDSQIFACQNLVIATGGNSNEILQDLGEEYKKFSPSLVALKSSEIKDLNGVKISNAKVRIVSHEIDYAECGEVLYKDGGLSGIVIFNISSLLARKSNYTGKVIIDILPNISLDDLKVKLTKRKKLNVSLDKIFVGMFVGSLANEIFRQAKVNTNVNSQNIDENTISRLAQAIKGLTYKIDGHFDNHQVYSGGVLLKNLDENLMSRKTKNLYFVGEVCDVDGMCGGYNLQWAFTSGAIVGEKL